MKKQELETRLAEIQSKLAVLGDLNVLIQKGAELPALVKQAQENTTAASALIPKLTTQQQSLTTLTTEITELKEDLTKHSTNLEGLSEKTNSLQIKTEELRQETLTQLGLAASEKLSNSFEQVKFDLAAEKRSWFYWLVSAVVALVLLTIGIAVWQVKEIGTLYHLSFLIKIALTSPLVYFVVFVNREYSRTRNLIEEYTFKAAIARSFEAYKEILMEAFEEQQTLVYQKKLDFILQAVTNLYSSPMQNVKANMIKEKEISPDIISQVREHLTSPSVPKN